MEAELVLFDESIPKWEQAFYAFLAEKERRSGSRRTAWHDAGLRRESARPMR